MALAAALCSGAAAVLQAVAVRRLAPGTGLSPRLLWHLARSGWYLAGLALVALGFVLAVAALRGLPLFLVAVTRASSLGVTAVLARVTLRVRLRSGEVVALGALGLGLVLLAASARPGPPVAAPGGVRLDLLAALLALAAATAGLGRSVAPRAGALLGTVAGLAFALLAVTARFVGGHPAIQAMADPAA